MEDNTKNICFCMTAFLLIGFIILAAFFVLKPRKENMVLFARHGGVVPKDKPEDLFDEPFGNHGNTDPNVRNTIYHGLDGAPWGIRNGTPEENKALQNVGWSWGGYETPFKKPWFDSSYDWFFEPKYRNVEVKLNLHDGCSKMCLDNYKECVDSGSHSVVCSLPLEKCAMSCPVMPYEAIGW